MSAPNVNYPPSPVEPLLVGEAMYRLIRELYPICRSITGNGVRETLRLVGRHIPLSVREIPTGTQVFDWSVPKEWNIRDAYIKNSDGQRIVDFRQSNLHVLNYSVPVHKTVSLGELTQHLFTLPSHPDWIPYRTSYYSENWGFCLTHNQLQALSDEPYEVCIDASLQEGCLTYGECYLPGQSSDEILLSCHICHPSLCNDNLSGIALCTFLAQRLLHSSRRHSYRFLFIPGTIGAIAWLALNEAQVDRIKHGLVVACVGDPGKLTYKKSRRGNAEIDRVVAHVLSHIGQPFEILEFSPYGYDERQFCSPGFNLPVGSLTRTPHGRYPQYHTSADNLDLVDPSHLADSFSVYWAVLDVLEKNNRYRNLYPKCEPQLGKRGLYGKIGGNAHANEIQLAMLWVLNFSDGANSLLDISDRANLRFELVAAAADLLKTAGLIEQC